MCTEKIAQSDERSYGFDIGGWLGVFDSLQLVFSRLDTFWCKCEAQVGDFLVAEKTFIKVYLEVMGVQPLLNLFQNFDVILVRVRVDE